MSVNKYLYMKKKNPSLTPLLPKFTEVIEQWKLPSAVKGLKKDEKNRSIWKSFHDIFGLPYINSPTILFSFKHLSIELPYMTSPSSPLLPTSSK